MSSPYSYASSRTITHFNDDGFDDDSPNLFTPITQRYSPELSPIFYLRMAITSTTVVEVFGPFATPAGVIWRLRSFVEGRWLGALFYPEGGIDRFLHFGMTVTLMDSLTATNGHNHVLNVQVIREDNRDVKEIIRLQPVWTVVCTEMQHHAMGTPTIRARQVLRSFPPTEAGGEGGKGPLARSTAETKLTDGNTSNARMASDLLGVNHLYQVVGTSTGWSIEANFHEGPDIQFETASDGNGRHVKGAVLNTLVLAQQHMQQQG